MRSLKADRRYSVNAPPARPVPPRADPAPSRFSYRMERLWLTPLFRTTLRVGLPAFLAAAAVGLYLSSDANRATIAAKYADLRSALQNRPEFMVTLMEIDGASPAVDGAVRDMLALTVPVSSFTLDLDGMRQRIEGLDAVASAELRVHSGGVLQVRLRERLPVVIWRTPQGMELLDESGHRVATLLAREARADLPLIAGEGASHRVPEALAVLAAAGPLLKRVRGLVYMGERRWDMVLDRDQRLLLPEVEPAVAVQRVVALDEAQHMLDRDIQTVDLRNPARPTLRLGPDALASLRGETAGSTDGATKTQVKAEVSGQ